MQLLSARELAQRYGVGIATIHLYRRRDWIPAIRYPGQVAYFFDPVACDEALSRRGWTLPSPAVLPEDMP